jgi:hypothetical protein
MKLKGLLGRVAGVLGLLPSASVEPAQSTLADDIPVAADWIARALGSSGYKADFTRDSIREIERFFETQSAEGEPVAGGLLSEGLGARLFALGCYCGEVLRRDVGGEWLTDDSDPEGEINIALKLADGSICWPVQRVMKRLDSAENNLVHWAMRLRNDPSLVPINHLFQP